MAESRQVVITGLGVVGPLGVGTESFYDALAAGTVGVRRIQAFDPGGFPCQVAGEIGDFSARDYVPKSYRKAVKVMARDIELAIGAADVAVRDSGLVTPAIDPERTDVDPTRLGVNIGAGLICADLTELGQAVQQATENGRFSLARWGQEGLTHLTPLWLLKYLPNMLSSHVTIIHDAQGPSNTITCSDASALLSVGEATRAIQRNDVDIELCGGAESKLNPMGLLRECLLGRMTTTHNDCPESACRPFDRRRDGTVLGEGGAVLVLEEAARARGRNARIYAELVGFGSSSSAYSVTEPEPGGRGVADAIRHALADAKMSAERIDLIVPHGLGLVQHDLTEAAGIRAALGPRASEIPVWPIVSQTGNTGAGSGAAGIAAAVLAMQRRCVPAAVNCPEPDPACGLSISSRPRSGAFDCAMVLSYAHGGQAAAAIVKRF